MLGTYLQYLWLHSHVHAFHQQAIFTLGVKSENDIVVYYGENLNINCDSHACHTLSLLKSIKNYRFRRFHLVVWLEVNPKKSDMSCLIHLKINT